MRITLFAVITASLLLASWWVAERTGPVEAESAELEATEPTVVAESPEETVPPVPVAASATDTATSAEDPRPLQIDIADVVSGIGSEEPESADYNVSGDKLPDLFKKAREKEKTVSVSATPTLGFEDDDKTKPTIVGGNVDVEVKLK